MYEAVIFDVDGVLVDSPHEAAWRAALTTLLADPTIEERFSNLFYQQQVAGRPRQEGAAAALAGLGIPDPHGQLCQDLMQRKQTILLELVAAGQFSAFPDAIRLVLRCKQAGVQLAAASSSQNAAMFLAKIEVSPFASADYPLAAGTRLGDLFDVDCSGQPLPKGKPDPAIFLNAAAALGIPPTSCIVVEDAPAGIVAARSAKMTAIGIDREGHAEALWLAGANFVLDSLDRWKWPKQEAIDPPLVQTDL